MFPQRTLWYQAQAEHFSFKAAAGQTYPGCDDVVVKSCVVHW